MEASAPACTYPSRVPWAPAAVTATNRTVTPPSRAVARRRAAASWRARTAVDSGSGEEAGAAVIVAVGSIRQPPVGSRRGAKIRDRVGGVDSAGTQSGPYRRREVQMRITDVLRVK